MSSSPTPDFGRLAATYDRLRPADANWREVYRLVVERADLRGRRVLDVGCGTGRLAAALAQDGSRVWGVDASPEMVEVAKAKRIRGAEFRVGHADSLPFRDGWFERAVFWLSIHLLERPRALGEARRMLASGGRVAVVTFDHSHFDAYWLNRFLPSLEAIDRARFPMRDALERELRETGFANVESVTLDQRATLTRDEALQRIRERHISTFDLISEDEYERGLDEATRALPEVVAYDLRWLLTTGEAP